MDILNFLKYNLGIGEIKVKYTTRAICWKDKLKSNRLACLIKKFLIKYQFLREATKKLFF